MKLQEIHKLIGGELHGDPNTECSEVKASHDAAEGHISFIHEKRFDNIAKNPTASAYITYKHFDSIQNQIVLKDTRKAMAQLLDAFFPNFTPITFPTHGPISDSASIHESASIAHNVTIGDNAVIEENVTLFPGVFVGKDVTIKANTTVHPNVTIYDNCVIGQHVIIFGGATIGSDGFGYYKNGEAFVKIPQVGRVVLADNVEIGPNCAIDRGCIGDTIVDKGTKLDNLVHIAHNTRIGKHSAITGQVGTTGSAVIGNHVMIGGQAGISTVEVGDNVIIAAKSGVTKDIQSNSFVSGFPAWEHKKELLKEAWLRKAFQKRKKD